MRTQGVGDGGTTLRETKSGGYIGVQYKCHKSMYGQRWDKEV